MTTKVEDYCAQLAALSKELKVNAKLLQYMLPSASYDQTKTLLRTYTTRVPALELELACELLEIAKERLLLPVSPLPRTMPVLLALSELHYLDEVMILLEEEDKPLQDLTELDTDEVCTCLRSMKKKLVKGVQEITT